MIPVPNPDSHLLDGLSLADVKRALRLLVAGSNSLGLSGLQPIGTPEEPMLLLDVARLVTNVSRWVVNESGMYTPNLTRKQREVYDLGRADVFALTARAIVDPEFEVPLLMRVT